MILFNNLTKRSNLLNIKIGIAIKKVINHGKFIMGPEIYELEEKLSSYCSAKHVITCSSGTDALILIFMAEKLKKKDAVFVPTFTFISTVESIVIAGGTPILIDVEKDTFNINKNSLKNGINIAIKNGLNTKYIVIVNLFGQPADFDSINYLAKKYNMKIIIDAAQSFGAKYKNNIVGSYGYATITSFYPTKPFSCFGDGGCIFTNNDNLASKLKLLRNHGFKNFSCENIGLNARLDTIQAAILLQKLKFFDYENNMRIKIAKSYNLLFKNILEIPFILNNVDTIWSQYTILLKNNIVRNLFRYFLHKSGISTMIYYKKPIHKQKAYMHFLKSDENLSISENLSSRILSLPIYPYMSSHVRIKIAKNICNISKIIN